MRARTRALAHSRTRDNDSSLALFVRLHTLLRYIRYRESRIGYLFDVSSGLLGPRDLNVACKFNNGNHYGTEWKPNAAYLRFVFFKRSVCERMKVTTKLIDHNSRLSRSDIFANR